MITMTDNGYFRRHLEFWRELQGDFWGLLVCYSTHIPKHILKNAACYEPFPGFSTFYSNALGLLLSKYFRHIRKN